MDDDMEAEPLVADEASDEEPDNLDDLQDFNNGLSDKDLSKVLTVEDFLHKSKTFMLEYEKQMFMDTIDADCLVVSAKYVMQWLIVDWISLVIVYFLIIAEELVTNGLWRIYSEYSAIQLI